MRSEFERRAAAGEKPSDLYAGSTVLDELQDAE